MIEQELCSSFTLESENLYRSRLNIYKYQTLHYKPDEFRNLTDGAGDNQQFRRYLSEYIKKFRDEKTEIDKTGIISPKGITYEEMSEEEKLRFNYRCFLILYNFWEEISCMIDLHHEPRKIQIEETFKKKLNLA